jgi:HlyD family secretion protein
VLALLRVVVAAMACAGPRTPPALLVAGHVEATEVRVPARVAGVLRSLPIEEGVRVAEAEEIGRMDTEDIEIALEAARAARDEAEAALRLAIAGPRGEEVREAEALVEVARAELEAAERDVSRMEELFARGSGTEKGRDDARTRRRIAAGRLEAAEQRLRRLRAGSRPEEIEAAKARLGAASARIAQLQKQKEDAILRSPVAGVVTEKLAEPGEYLSPGSPVAVVTDLDHAWLTVFLPEPELGRVRIGQQAEILTDDGQKRRGWLSYIASKAEFTPKNVQTRDERVQLVYRAKIRLDNSDGLFKPGMPAEARLEAVGSAP